MQRSGAWRDQDQAGTPDERIRPPLKSRAHSLSIDERQFRRAPVESASGVADRRAQAYGVMSVGRPFLFVGPEHCHVTDLIDETKSGWAVRHGDVDATVGLLINALAARATLPQKGRAGQELVANRFAQSKLSAQLAEILEAVAKE